MASTKTGAIGTGNAASVSAFLALENGRGPTNLVGPLSRVFFLVVAVAIVIAGLFVAVVALVGLLDHRLLVGRLGHDRLRRGLVAVSLVLVFAVPVDQARVSLLVAAGIIVLTAGGGRRWGGRREVGGQA